MKFHQKVEALYTFFFSFTAICFIWMGLEWLIYGEIQHRIVDDIISLFWSAMAWAAYYLGYLHGKDLR